MTSYTLRILQNTILKQELLPVEQLPDREKAAIEAGKELPIRSYLQVVDHLRFTLHDNSIMGLNGFAEFPICLCGGDG